MCRFGSCAHITLTRITRTHNARPQIRIAHCLDAHDTRPMQSCAHPLCAPTNRVWIPKLAHNVTCAPTNTPWACTRIHATRHATLGCPHIASHSHTLVTLTPTTLCTWTHTYRLVDECGLPTKCVMAVQFPPTWTPIHDHVWHMDAHQECVTFHTRSWAVTMLALGCPHDA